MITVSGGVSPLDFMGFIVLFNKEVDLKVFRVLADGIRNADSLTLLCVLQNGYGCFFEKSTSIFINKTAYVLIKIDLTSFFFRKTE